MIEKAIESIVRQGTLIDGRYRPRRILGKGGMGWVIQAEDIYLDDQLVVLKFLYPHLVNNERILLGFRSEVLVARRIIHHSVVRTYNFAQDSRLGHYIVMEFVPGETLRHLIDQSAGELLPINSVTRILETLLQGIRYAHSYGVIHLDIKPENVFLNERGEAKLGDFGVAQSIRQGNEGTGRMIGTPLYMAPEQFRGALLGKETDIYSLGILAYEMLVGQPPFCSNTIYNLAQMHQNDVPAEITKVRRDVPDWLLGMVNKCLSKRPEERFSSADELLALMRLYNTESERMGSEILPSLGAVSQRGVRSGERWPVWINKWTLSICILFFVVTTIRAGRGRVWLHQTLLTATLLAEKNLGVELHGVRSLFLLRTKWSTSFFDASDEAGALKALIFLGAPIDQYDTQNGRSFLVTMASATLESEELDVLLEAGANPNVQDSNGRTALHVLRGPVAARRAKLLLDKGAEVDRQDKFGVTPLLVAVKGYEFDLARTLFAHGADPNLPDSTGTTPLSLAKTLRDPRFVTLLESRRETRLPLDFTKR